MGLFDGLSSLGSSIAGSLSGGVLGKVAGAAQAKQPKTPSYGDIVGSANRAATDYRQRMPELAQGQRNVAMDTGRGDLAKAYVNADRSANRRGMFYGGKRAGLRSNAESGVADDLANKFRGINVAGEDTARGIEDTAIEGGFGLRSDTQAKYNSEYNEALSRRQQRQDQLNSILGGAASLAGMAIAGPVGGAIGSQAGGLLGGGGGNQYSLNPGNRTWDLNK